MCKVWGMKYDAWCMGCGMGGVQKRRLGNKKGISFFDSWCLTILFCWFGGGSSGGSSGRSSGGIGDRIESGVNPWNLTDYPIWFDLIRWFVLLNKKNININVDININININSSLRHLPDTYSVHSVVDVWIWIWVLAWNVCVEGGGRLRWVTIRMWLFIRYSVI